MILGTVLQQPAESLDYDIDYSEFFAETDDSISSFTVEDGTDELEFTKGIGSGDIIKVWIAGGVAGNTYTATITMTSTDGRVKQDEIIVAIQEI